ncbi:MAG: FHA domain-containing protein [Planctomycetaceae bacterium]|jgi:hypothetical protein|nr:FHA domain-containing protein [Planctomycetaceae bacterium]
MALVTVRILDGPDRGKRFDQLATPVTIGREDGNQIQLNDYRVSRHHLKIHENGDSVLITDLQSTNGTKINGESVRVWQLQPGDLITLGQSILLFGSATEIAERLAALKKTDLSTAVPMGTGGDESEFMNRMMGSDVSNRTQSTHQLAREIFSDWDESELLALKQLSPPSPPKNLSPQQSAQMEAFLQYLHLRLRHLVATVRSTHSAHPSPHETSTNARISIAEHQWQNIIDLHSQISGYLSGSAWESDA